MSDHKRPGKQRDLSPKMRSNSSVFSRRGDPWITDKEGMSSFGRNIERENPDYDQYFAKKAEVDKRPSIGGVPVGTIKPKKPRVATTEHKSANRIRALRLKHKGKL